MIRQRKDRDGLQVQVYAGRDPITGRKRWVSRQVPGKGEACEYRRPLAVTDGGHHADQQPPAGAGL